MALMQTNMVARLREIHIFRIYGEYLGSGLFEEGAGVDARWWLPPLGPAAPAAA